ncbi:hypothetical protein F5Y07DRAFT_404630 [Xylaria sp. FL0933]|nr:hypothetical protein F5Y07DRAFT_404630 [Xylaria sp. FL0933]
MATILDPNELRHSFAMLQYLKRLGKYEEEKPYLIGYDVPLEDENERSNLEFDNVTVPIYDVRPKLENLRVDWNGFEVIRIPSELMKSYFDIRDINSELEGVKCILEKHFKTDKVIIYDHTYRKEEDQSTESLYTFQDRPNHSLVIRHPHAGGQLKASEAATIDSTN